MLLKIYFIYLFFVCVRAWWGPSKYFRLGQQKKILIDVSCIWAILKGISSKNNPYAK